MITEERIEIREDPVTTLKQIFQHSRIALASSVIGLLGLLVSLVYNPDFFPRIFSLGFLTLMTLYVVFLLIASKVQSTRTSETDIPIDKIRNVKLKPKGVLRSDLIEFVYMSDGDTKGRIVWMEAPFVSFEKSMEDVEEVFEKRSISVQRC